MKKIFEIEMSVRDYECDLQGIVNNSVYQNYLEHARHEFLHQVGFDFSEWHNQGKDAVVIRAELDYKQSLTPNDKFVIECGIVKKGAARIQFKQNIRRLSDNVICLKGLVTSVIVDNGRPARSDIFFDVLDKKGFEYEVV